MIVYVNVLAVFGVNVVLDRPGAKPRQSDSHRQQDQQVERSSAHPKSIAAGSLSVSTSALCFEIVPFWCLNPPAS